ncbi:MAG: alpha/beta hydrolase family protein [Desulfitobacterium sp.]
MMSTIILLFVLSIEIGLVVYSLKTNSQQNRAKHIIRLATFGLFALLLVFHVIQWGFQWILLFLVLLIQAVLSGLYFVRKSPASEKPLKTKRVILTTLGHCLFMIAVLVPALIFPQFKALPVTGPYPVQTESYTLTDPSRIESYDDTGSYRNVTIQFWYPENHQGNETYPLLLFSHGSFGFRGSNYSTFKELASHGYVVGSIDHTYHAFFTKQTDGEMIFVNTNFMNDAIAIQSQTSKYNEQETYELTHQWLKLRSEDMNLVLDTILENVKKENTADVYRIIDPKRIGLFGHSLGGATAADLGRKRTDIDAVVILDGTMLGEEIDYDNGQMVLNKEPYPTPLLDIFNEEHFSEASALGENYGNMKANKHAVDARQVVFEGAGHLNFTDLPLFSPVLAGILGTGDIDSRYCLETMNEVVLNYFDYYLKDLGELKIQAVY